MFYQTLYHPFIFTFNTFNSSSSPSLQVVETEMESVQGALKMSQNVVQFDQPATEDLWAGNGQQQAEEFCVDDLLDFSNDLVQPLEEEEQTIELEKEHPEQQNPQNYDNPLNNSSVTDVFASLSVPVDDLDNLEWLSHFVEDCEYSLTCPVGVAAKAKNRSEPDMTVNETNIFNTPVQTKARTKRSRAGLRVWSLGPASSTSSSSSASSTAESIKPAGLKLKKTVGRESLPRRCSHCGVQKTPQWRAGPLGVKTLCNACGVRYKSGRLLPEYRPACSPTFSTELHSNNHRKVLEMRQKKIGEIILS